MSQQNEAPGSDSVLPWRPGDVILAADGHLYIRAREELTVGGMWPWHEGISDAASSTYEGGTADADLKRPVTLLIRDGQPLGGVTVDEQASG
jgi:hypothetical protein